MKLPELARVDEAGVKEWQGPDDELKAASNAAHLRYFAVDLKGVDSKHKLLEKLAHGLHLPDHFGGNWDALADCFEDDSWVGEGGATLLLKHAAPYRNDHASDWSMLTDILDEAAEYWRERHKAFWAFVG